MHKGSKGHGNSSSAPNELTVIEVAKKFNVSIGTVNFYTNLGLLEESRRVGNKRYYALKHLGDLFTKIQELRNKGYSLRAIRGVLNEREKPLHVH